MEWVMFVVIIFLFAEISDIKKDIKRIREEKKNARRDY